MRYLLKLSQAFIDFLLVIFSFLLAYFFRLSIYLIWEWKYIHSDYPIWDYLLNSAIVWIIVVWIFLYQWRYSSNKPYKNLTWSFSTSIIWATIFILIYFFWRELFFSRLIPVYALFWMFLLLYFSYYIFTKIFSLDFIRKKFWKKILIIWANSTAENVIKSLQSDAWIRNIIWVLDAYWTKKKEINWIPVLWKMNIFEQIIKEKKIEEIIQADNLEQTLNIVNFCERNWLWYYLSPSLSWVYHDNIDVYRLNSWEALIYLKGKK